MKLDLYSKEVELVEIRATGVLPLIIFCLPLLKCHWLPEASE